MDATIVQDLRKDLGNGNLPDFIVVDYRQLRGENQATPEELKQLISGHPTLVIILCIPELISRMDKERALGFTILAKPVKPWELAKALVSGGRDPSLSSITDLQMTKLADRIPLRILLAEDNPINQEVAIGMLRNMGYRPHAVSDGKKVLQALMHNTYDLIFMDVQMPEMDGYEATAAIGIKYGESRPYIIAMTANAMAGDREKCLAAGMDGYVSKPVSTEEVSKAIIEKFGGDNFVLVENEKVTPSVSKAEPYRRQIDLTNLHEIAGGDPGFMTGIIQKIIARLPGSLKEITRLTEEQDWKGVKAAAHSIKSASGYSGSQALRATFQQIENIAESETGLDQLPALIQKADELSFEVIRELDAEISVWKV
jgi:CheY-like chemotaxis protein